MQNSGRCRYFKKINGKKNDGFQIRYLMLKFQLYLRKSIVIQAFRILVGLQFTIGISRLLACSLKKTSISRCWLVKPALWKLLRKLPLEAGPRREIFPGGTKIDAGPPKLGEEQKKGLHSNLVLFLPKIK